MNYAIESFFVAVFVLVACALVFIKTKPFIEKKDETAKKKWFLISCRGAREVTLGICHYCVLRGR